MTAPAFGKLAGYLAARTIDAVYAPQAGSPTEKPPLWGRFAHWLVHKLWPGLLYFTWGNYGRTRTCITCGRRERRVLVGGLFRLPRWRWRVDRQPR